MLDIGVLRFQKKTVEILWFPPDLIIRIGYYGIFISRKRKIADTHHYLERIQKIRLGNANANGNKSPVNKRTRR